MSDTLEIFGTEYTGVNGIIAKDDNGNDLTYVRPQAVTTVSAYVDNSVATVNITDNEDGTASAYLYYSGSDDVWADKSGLVTIDSNNFIQNSTTYVNVSGTGQLTTTTLPTTTSGSASSGYTSKATVSRSTSDQYINIAKGYNTANAYYKINAVPNGSATPASSISGTSASVSTGTNTLTLSKTVSNTPQVSEGYISSGTAGNSSVSLTASVTTKGATTYNTSSSDQTIASGTYLTGTQTIKAVTVSGLSANTILSGTTVKIGDANDDDRIASVSGSVTFSTIYTGTSAPSASLGVNGDIYIQG